MRKLLISLLILFCVQMAFAQKKTKIDSLKYYSAIFKDTLNVCNEIKQKSYDYIMKSKRVNHRNINKLIKYLGVDGVVDEQGYKVYYYALWCTCYDDGRIHWSGCDYIAIRTKGKKIIKIYGKNFS